MLSHQSESVTKDKYFWMQLRWDTLIIHIQPIRDGTLSAKQSYRPNRQGVAITKVEKWWLVLVVSLAYPGRGNLK